MLETITDKPRRLAVGLMSGTSVDGIDAALVELSGSAQSPSVRLLGFCNTPYPSPYGKKYSPSSTRRRRRRTGSVI